MNLVRYLLAVIFVMVGIMKLFIPKFKDAFKLQLIESNIPIVNVNIWIVPVLEIALGLALLFNIKNRIALILIIPLMLSAMYIHLVVNSPEAFPAQPVIPIVPIVILILTTYLLIKNFKDNGNSYKN